MFVVYKLNLLVVVVVILVLALMISSVSGNAIADSSN